MSNDRYANIRQALAECRDIAMEWTMRGRIPECGKFGEIAQDLDAVCAELENSTQWHPITDAERDQLAAALEAAREDAERYQWLRECAWLHPEAAPACAIFGVDGSVLRSIDGSDLDAAIDQARGTASEAAP
jgi:hypothetical protein